MKALRMQVCCYEDSKLLKLFTDIVRMLYDNDILAEDTINWWAKKVMLPAQELSTTAIALDSSSPCGSGQPERDSRSTAYLPGNYFYILCAGVG